MVMYWIPNAVVTIVVASLPSSFIGFQAIAPTPILLVQSEQKLEFPIPEDAINYTQQPTSGVGGSVNFQTELSLSEAIQFYRNQLAEQGLTEREINTAITDTTFNLVFDGAKNGLAVVVQGVELGNQRNINIRYEKLD